jgi:hypothetical protein
MVDFFLLSLELLSLVLKTGAFKTFLESVGPDELDTKKSDLGRVGIDEVTKSHGEAILPASLTNVLH